MAWAKRDSYEIVPGSVVEFLRDKTTGELIGYRDRLGNEYQMPAMLDANGIDAADRLPGHGAFASAVRAYLAGLRTRPPVIFGIGDSNFTGEGAGIGGGTSPKLTDSYPFGPIQQIKSVIPTLAGLTLVNGCFFGDGNVTANSVPINEYDSRITLASSGWTIDSSATYIGGRLYVATSGSTGWLTFNSGVLGADTVEVHFAIPGASGYGVSVGVYASDDTLLGSYNCNGTAGVSSVSFTSPKLADGIVKIRNDSTGTANIGGVMAYKASGSQAIVTQGTRSAATAATFADATAAYRGVAQLDTIRPDLTIVALTINDIAAGTATGTYNTNLTTVVQKALRWGDVIVATGQPGGTTNYTDNLTWIGIEAEAKKVAAANGASFVSMHKELVSYAAQNALGNTWDTSHMKASGYLLQSRVFARAIAALL